MAGHPRDAGAKSLDQAIHSKNVTISQPLSCVFLPFCPMVQALPSLSAVLPVLPSCVRVSVPRPRQKKCLGRLRQQRFCHLVQCYSMQYARTPAVCSCPNQSQTRYVLPFHKMGTILSNHVIGCRARLNVVAVADLVWEREGDTLKTPSCLSRP